MGYSADVVNSVREMYEKRRQAAVDLAKQHRIEVYERCPFVSQIDKALSLTGLSLIQASVGDEEGLSSRIERVKNENLELQNAKRQALREAGFPEDYTDIKYECPLCADTGYVGIDMCDCFRKELVKAAYASSGLGKYLKTQTFRNFDLSYYSDEKTAEGISCRDQMASVLEKAKKYVSDFGKEGRDSSLLFIGTTGLGKTHITTAIAKGVIDKGFDVVYDNAQNIMRAFEMHRFSRDEQAGRTVQRYFDCDLLIIDDLGTEFRNTFTQSALYELVNTRINAGKCMIVSTNIDSTQKLLETYDDRITSRLVGSFRMLKFVGKDIRILKAMQPAKKK